MGNMEGRENGPEMDGEMDLYQHLNQVTRTNLLRLTRAHNKFSVLLYQEFTRDSKLKHDNIILASLPISLGLGLTYLGARGKSREELDNVLQLHEVDRIILLPGLAAMHFDTFKSTVAKGCAQEVSAQMYITKDYYLTDEFCFQCNRFQLDVPKIVDFVNRSDHSRKEINDDIRSTTHGVVREAIPAAGVLDRNTKVLLSCVAHIQVRWNKPFDSKKTKKCTFTVNSKEVLQVSMMKLQLDTRFGEGVRLDCDILELSLENHYTKMYIFLPKKPEGLSKLERSLSRSLIHASIDGLAYELVDISLPKFTVEMETTLNEKLQASGLRTVFHPSKANFSGMCTNNKELCLSKVHQNVKLIVDEGDNGATSTSLGMTHLEVPSGMQVDPGEVKVFNADRPFLFILRDERTGAVVMCGRVCRPPT